MVSDCVGISMVLIRIDCLSACGCREGRRKCFGLWTFEVWSGLWIGFAARLSPPPVPYWYFLYDGFSSCRLLIYVVTVPAHQFTFAEDLEYRYRIKTCNSDLWNNKSA
jgi:hypothetical protein